MTTQRDRLAEMLHGFCLMVYSADLGDYRPCHVSDHYKTADSLIARGVRVVDVEALAAAFMVVAFPVGEPPYDVGPTWAHTFAKNILAALDAEP